ncbi:MAG TPA: nuclear transport factor 2 family protein [Gemmatimonadales bacterium]|nr:nuclear transport factor 2 family protein [Gemmatimonadales bacterium]
MRRESRLALLAVVLAASGCHIEDRTPAGTRRDEDAVQALVAAYARSLSERDWVGTRRLFWRDGSYSGPLIPRSVGQTLPIDSALAVISRRVDGGDPASFDVRVLRTDFRQDGDLAAVWVTLHRRMALPGGTVPTDRDYMEHLVLRRIGSQWRILSVAGSAQPRSGPTDVR